MKKVIASYLVIGSCFLSTPSIKSAAIPAAGLKGTYNSIPHNLQPFSPVHGAVIAENDLLKSIWQEESPLGDLARLMFNELDENMRCTAQPGNPVSVLSLSLLKRLMDYHTKTTGNPPYETLLPKVISLKADSKQPLKGLGLAWWITYKTWRGTSKSSSEIEGDFKKNARAFLKALDAATAYNNQETTDLLIAFAYLQSKTPEQLQNFFKLFYPPLQSQFFTEENFHEFETFFQTTALTSETAPHQVEQMVFWLLRRKSGSLHFLRPHLQYLPFEGKQIPLCVEGTIQTIVNTILYDPVTKRLSLAMVNPSLPLNPRFRTFIEAHDNPHLHNYFDTTLQEWAHLMMNIPNIAYKQEDKEIRALSENVLTVLNFLFGTHATTFTELGHLISCPTRTVTFTNPTFENDSSDDDSSDDDSSDDEDFGDDSDFENVSDTDDSNSSDIEDNAALQPEQPAIPEEATVLAPAHPETEQDEEIDTTEYLTLTVSSHDFKPMLKIKIQQSPEPDEQAPEQQAAGHAQVNFTQEGSRIPTIIALDNMKLVEDLIHEDLVTLFDIDWYRTIIKAFKNKLFTNREELLTFLRSTHATPEQIAAPSDDGDYILEEAIWLGKKDFVQALIDFGVPVTYYPDDSDTFFTPLRTALNNIKAVKAGIPQLLIENGATITPEQINTPSETNGARLFDLMSWRPYLPQVELLLQLGADPNLPDLSGTPPLWYATLDHNLPLMELLLRYNADPNFSKNGISLLTSAAWTKNEPEMHLLLEYGADPNTIVHNDPVLTSTVNNPPLFHLLLEYGANPNALSEIGVTVLSSVLWQKNAEMVQALLEHGADPRIESRFAVTYKISPLMQISSYLPELEDLMKAKAAELEQKEHALAAEL